MEHAEFYRRYLRCCNERRFDDLGEFVAAHVEVNGEPSDLTSYAAGLRSVVETWPDFRWHLQHVLVDGDRLAALLVDTFIGPDGRAASLQELAMYRLEEGRIVQVWGDLGPERLPPPP